MMLDQTAELRGAWHSLKSQEKRVEKVNAECTKNRGPFERALFQVRLTESILGKTTSRSAESVYANVKNGKAPLGYRKFSLYEKFRMVVHRVTILFSKDARQAHKARVSNCQREVDGVLRG